MFVLQSDENEPEQPSDSDGSTKGEPQVNINSPTMHLPTQMYQLDKCSIPYSAAYCVGLFLKDFEVLSLPSSVFHLV